MWEEKEKINISEQEKIKLLISYFLSLQPLVVKLFPSLTPPPAAFLSLASSDGILPF